MAGRGELKFGLRVILTLTAPSLAGEVGCVRGQVLATGVSRRIFPKKKKTLWGTLGNSLAATAPVCSPPSHSPVRGVYASTGDCVHLILEGAETEGTTLARVPSNLERSFPQGSAHTSSRKELRLQAPPRQQQPKAPNNPECSYPPGSARTPSRSELRPQEPGRVRIKEGSACTPIAQRRPTIKKEWVETGNTRIPPGRGNTPTKESPTDNRRR